jgi:Ca2+-binding EF-hand superfamily protein
MYPPTSCLLFIFRQAMIDEFDLDQDGEINLQEFITIMTDEA